MKEKAINAAIVISIIAAVGAFAYGIIILGDIMDRGAAVLGEKEWKLYNQRAQEYKAWCEGMGQKVHWDDRKRYVKCH